MSATERINMNSKKIDKNEVKYTNRPIEFKYCLIKDRCEKTDCEDCPYLPSGKKYYEEVSRDDGCL